MKLGQCSHEVFTKRYFSSFVVLSWKAGSSLTHSLKSEDQKVDSQKIIIGFSIALTAKMRKKRGLFQKGKSPWGAMRFSSPWKALNNRLQGAFSIFSRCWTANTHRSVSLLNWPLPTSLMAHRRNWYERAGMRPPTVTPVDSGSMLANSTVQGASKTERSAHSQWIVN